MQNQATQSSFKEQQPYRVLARQQNSTASTAELLKCHSVKNRRILTQYILYVPFECVFQSYIGNVSRTYVDVLASPRKNSNYTFIPSKNYNEPSALIVYEKVRWKQSKIGPTLQRSPIPLINMRFSAKQRVFFKFSVEQESSSRDTFQTGQFVLLSKDLQKCRCYTTNPPDTNRFSYNGLLCFHVFILFSEILENFWLAC